MVTETRFQQSFTFSVKQLQFSCIFRHLSDNDPAIFLHFPTLFRPPMLNDVHELSMRAFSCMKCPAESITIKYNKKLNQEKYAFKTIGKCLFSSRPVPGMRKSATAVLNTVTALAAGLGTAISTSASSSVAASWSGSNCRGRCELVAGAVSAMACPLEVAWETP